VQQQLAPPNSGNSLAWVPLAKFHLTLFYLGTTPVSLLVPLKAALTEAAGTCPAFPLGLGKLDCFPATGTPRVLFVEVLDPIGGLQQFYTQLCKALAQFDFHPDHDLFRPHVTIGRAGRRATTPRQRIMREWTAHAPEGLPESLMVEEAVFFRSLPERGAPVYQVLERLPLADPAPAIE